MVKPTLNVLGACHCLALIEGQKENKKRKRRKTNGWCRNHYIDFGVSCVHNAIKGRISKKEGRKMKRVAILLLIAIMMTFLISQCYASTIIDHATVDSDNDWFQLITYVHKDEDSVPGEDFYGFQMRVHAKHYSDHIYCEISVYSPEGIFDKWEPTAGKKGGTFGFSYGETISFSVTCPEAYINVYGVNTHEISWQFSGCTTVSDVDFACGMYTAEGATPHWTIEVYVYDYTIIAGIPIELWRDTATWSTHQLSISASYGGTTNPTFGTYTYTSDDSVTITASPYSGWHFDFWILDGTPKYSNPITVTMDSDHTLTAYFGINGGGGGGDGCPTLFVWNGDNYVDYGVIDIHNPSGEDVVREVSIAKQDLAVEDSKAKLRLQEGWEGLNFSESVVD
jgi:hypothetical protein